MAFHVDEFFNNKVGWIGEAVEQRNGSGMVVGQISVDMTGIYTFCELPTIESSCCEVVALQSFKAKSIWRGTIGKVNASLSIGRNDKNWIVVGLRELSLDMGGDSQG